MATTSFRTDDAVEAAIERLRASTSRSRSEVIRQAILDADQSARRALMRAQAEALLQNPAERAETAAVLEFMEDGRAW